MATWKRPVQQPASGSLTGWKLFEINVTFQIFAFFRIVMDDRPRLWIAMWMKTGSAVIHAILATHCLHHSFFFFLQVREWKPAVRRTAVLLDLLAAAYPWTKSLHVISVITWMAGLFYLPRLYVYHAEKASAGSEMSETFKIMEMKLLRIIMNPAMISSWLFGLLLAFTPGIVDWSGDHWFHVKLAMLLAMTWFHHSLARWRKSFAADANTRPGRYYRGMNEVPTLLMIVIVVMAIVKPF